MYEMSSTRTTGQNEDQGNSETPFHAIDDPEVLVGGGKAPHLPLKRSKTVMGDVEEAGPAGLFARMLSFTGNDDEETEEVARDSGWLTPAKRKTIISSLYMSVFAIAGALLRIALAQFFGEACANPATIGWLNGGEPLCVTKNGEADIVGGIVFADLPANLLGSFIMGMMQTGFALDLPINSPAVWLRESHYFQSCDIIHLAIRTGFCGSLTTFSSWNSEMVVMMFGTGSKNKHSDWIRALLGYVIGLETALGSFVFGKNVATWIHRATNPAVAAEADAIVEAEKRGVYVNRDLPEFERRYLADLDMVPRPENECDPTSLKHLERWRNSTKEHRRYGNERLGTLMKIEKTVLVKRQRITDDLRASATQLGWDIDGLDSWIFSTTGFGNKRLVDPFSQPAEFSMGVALLVFLPIIAVLLFGLVVENGDDAFSNTYRTMWYACVCAPFGALLRWQLGSLNGKLGGDWTWLPLGTLTANVLAALISISMIALEVRRSDSGDGINDSFWVAGTMRAIKIGFCGCLSTVSTWIAEVSVLMKTSHQHGKGYKYVLITLGLSCSLAVIMYGLVVYV